MDTDVTTTQPAEFQMIPIGSLRESRHNPRKHFDKDALDQLTENVKRMGVLTPLIARPVGDGFELAAGHRRYRAAKAAGIDVLPVRVRTMDDTEFLEVLNIENLLRDDIHPMEEAAGYENLLKQPGYDVAMLAAKTGKSGSYIYQRLKLLALVPKVRKLFLENKISAGHAILIARLQDDQQAEVVAWAAEGHRREIASVRELNQHIHESVLLDLTKAPFDITDADLVKKAGACSPCPYRAGNQAELFSDVKKGDTCTAPTCFRAKITAHLERITQQVHTSTKKKPVRIGLGWNPPHGRTKKDYPGVVFKGYGAGEGYRIITKDGCPHAQPAVVWCGDYTNEGLGRVVTICRESKCKKGEPRSSSGSSSSTAMSPAERKRRQAEAAAAEKRRAKDDADRKVRMAIADAVLEKLPGLGAFEMRQVAMALLADVTFDDTGVELARRHGMEPTAKRGAMIDGNAIEKHLEKVIEALDAKALSRFMMEILLLADASKMWRHGKQVKPGSLGLEMAKLRGVNAAQIEKTTRAAIAAVAKKPATPPTTKKAPAAKIKKKSGKQPAATKAKTPKTRPSKTSASPPSPPSPAAAAPMQTSAESAA